MISVVEASTSGAMAAAEVADPAGWHLYLLECQGGKLYAGIAKDVEQRFQAHLTGKGAKFTRANPPLRVLATRAYPDRSLASKAEYALKMRPRRLKLQFFDAPAASQADNDHDYEEEATCQAPTP